MPSLSLSVLGYREDGEWAALALEMDLRGYGSTFEQAVKDLIDLVQMQISFAIFKGQPDLVWKPAEPVYWQLFENVRRERIRDIALVHPPSAEREYEVGSVPIPAPHVIQPLAKFHPVNG